MRKLDRDKTRARRKVDSLKEIASDLEPDIPDKPDQTSFRANYEPRHAGKLLMWMKPKHQVMLRWTKPGEKATSHSYGFAYDWDHAIRIS